jgi:methyl-accepting chemotaxis protein
MLGAMARMQTSLRDLVGQLQRATRHVAHASEDIARGNHDLSQRTEHGALQLQAASEHLAMLSETTTLATQAAERGQQVARQASASAQASGASIEALAGTIHHMARDAQRIADITSQAHGQQQDIAALHAAVHALSDHAQHNSALVQESAAAALSLQEQAGALSRIATRFALPA